MRSQYNLWPIGDIVSENNKGILFGMNEAFERIWKHQHPVNCSTSKFLISGFEKSIFLNNLIIVIIINYKASIMVDLEVKFMF